MYDEGRFYENSNAKMDGNLTTNVRQLRKMIAELLIKIQEGKEGTDEEIASVFYQNSVIYNLF